MKGHVTTQMSLFVLLMANGCLDKQEQQFLHSCVCVLEKGWNKCLSGDCWKVTKVTKDGVHLLWLTVLGQEVFEWPL